MRFAASNARFTISHIPVRNIQDKLRINPTLNGFPPLRKKGCPCRQKTHFSNIFPRHTEKPTLTWLVIHTLRSSNVSFHDFSIVIIQVFFPTVFQTQVLGRLVNTWFPNGADISCHYPRQDQQSIVRISIDRLRVIHWQLSVIQRVAAHPSDSACAL